MDDNTEHKDVNVGDLVIRALFSRPAELHAAKTGLVDTSTVRRKLFVIYNQKDSSMKALMPDQISVPEDYYVVRLPVRLPIVTKIATESSSEQVAINHQLRMTGLKSFDDSGFNDYLVLAAKDNHSAPSQPITAAPTQEIFIAITKKSYRRLAQETLKRMADPVKCAQLFDAGPKSMKELLGRPNSDPSLAIDNIVKSRALGDDELDAVMREAQKTYQHYEFMHRMREARNQEGIGEVQEALQRPRTLPLKVLESGRNEGSREM